MPKKVQYPIKDEDGPHVKVQKERLNKRKRASPSLNWRLTMEEEAETQTLLMAEMVDKLDEIKEGLDA